MSRRGENIYKRKDLRWEGRYIKYHNESGKAIYGYVYASTYSEVKQKLFETKQRAGNNPTNTTINSNGETFKTILVNWTKMLQINTKESTFARYNHLINSHIVPFLGEYQTSQITNQLVENLIKHLLTNGRKDGKGGLSNKTVADILVLVKRSIAYASDCGYVINCKLNKVSVRTTSPEMKVFTLEEQRYLHTYLTKDMTSEKLGILLCLYTGIRIGELCALKWKNINTVSNVLEIRKTMIRIQNTNNNESQKTKLIISEPKSRCSIRDIPIPNCIMNYILEVNSQSKCNCAS